MPLYRELPAAAQTAYAELYELVRRDALIIFCMSNGFTLEQTEAELLRKGEASLYERS